MSFIRAGLYKEQISHVTWPVFKRTKWSRGQIVATVVWLHNLSVCQRWKTLAGEERCLRGACASTQELDSAHFWPRHRPLLWPMDLTVKTFNICTQINCRQYRMQKKKNKHKICPGLWHVIATWKQWLIFSSQKAHVCGRANQYG